MLFRPMLALVLAFCLTFITAPSSASAAFVLGNERGNAQFGKVVNSGQANSCKSISSGSTGSISADGGFTDLCLQPTEIFVKVASSKRKKADFVPAKIISPANNTAIDQVYGDLSGGKFAAKGGIDFALITVLAPSGVEYPLVFSVKDMVASGDKSIASGADFSGTTLTPSYRTGDFLDPKSRAKDTGVEYAQGLIALGGDDEDLERENIKRDLTGNGEITLSIESVDSSTNEFAGSFVAIQPSDNDLGSRDPVDVKITGTLYGRKA
ncbi:photosystem II manganese-stabilizing polypeptide [Prochlorococcus sp. MIT 1341]|uniref:photosystem II manganese-stabilizing polypeptide n=1 Tax=Prochlorococcus sp. MIT 1341 TaxID=3096221 RepID=UPI002A750A47|nr:photosystem II manganese-stabilizing polypeptide [Prochlorococcus sp. MIT 1341]